MERSWPRCKSAARFLTTSWGEVNCTGQSDHNIRGPLEVEWTVNEPWLESRYADPPFLSVSSPSAWPNLREYNPAVVSHDSELRVLVVGKYSALSWASHRGHFCQVSQANSWFLSDIGHTTRKKKATGHCSRQNIIKSASKVLPAILNVLLGALRHQQELREGKWSCTEAWSRRQTAQTAKKETKWTSLRVQAGYHTDPMGKAHQYAAICTRQGAEHITHEKCEISPWCLLPCACTLQPCVCTLQPSAGRPRSGGS